MADPNLIFFDLETTNLSGNFGFILCAGYKRLGDQDTTVISITDFPSFKRDPTNDYHVVKALADVLREADVTCGWYSSRFDVPFVQSRLLFHKLSVLPPTPHIDGWWIARKKLKLNSNRLATVQAFLGLPTEKTILSGPIWVRAAAGHRPSIKYVVDHCKADVQVLEEAYLRLRPLMTNHPNLNLIQGSMHACPACGGRKVQRRGYHVSRTRKYHRLHCQSCGTWSKEAHSVASAEVA